MHVYKPLERKFYRLSTQFGRKLIIEISMSIGHAMMKYIMYRLKLIKPIRVNYLQTRLPTYKYTYTHLYIHAHTCMHIYIRNSEYIHKRLNFYLSNVSYVTSSIYYSDVTWLLQLNCEFPFDVTTQLCGYLNHTVLLLTLVGTSIETHKSSTSITNDNLATIWPLGH